MEKYGTIKYRGCDINIYYDNYAVNPRSWSNFNLGSMHFFVPDYSIGDVNEFDSLKMLFYKSIPWSSWIYADLQKMSENDFIEKYRRKFEQHNIALPLYFNYDYIKCANSYDKINGIIYVTNMHVRTEYLWERISLKRRLFVKEILKTEVSLYNKYLNGEIYQYGILLFDDNNLMSVVSSSGYFDLNHLEEDAKMEIDSNLTVNGAIINDRSLH